MNEREITIREAIQEALQEEFILESTCFIIGEDLHDDRRQEVLTELKEKHPDRFIVTPLLEDMICDIGLGMSMGGLKPVVGFSYGTFITLALDGIYRLGHWRYRMAENEGPHVIVRISYGGEARGSEFSASLLGLTLHLPNIWIAVPSSPYFAKGLLKTALHKSQPILFFEHKNLYEKKGHVPSDDYTIPFGTSIITRQGTDITLITWSFMNEVAVKAAEILEKEGIRVEVISLQTLNPIDMMTILRSVEKTKRVVILEEGQLRGGIGAEISMRILENIPRCLIKRVASKNVPLPPGKYERLVIPTTDQTITVCRELKSMRSDF